MTHTHALSITAALAAVVLGSASAPAQCDPQEVAKLLPDDGAEEDRFGNSVAISGATAIIGAPLDDDQGDKSGSAYLFDTTTGQQIAKLLPDDGAEGDSFGTSVAISGATAIVGAPLDDDQGDDSGSAYLFDTTTGRQIAKLLPDDGAEGHQFGISVAINGPTVIVGALSDDDNGSAYLFDSTTGRQIAELLPNDGAADHQFGHSVAVSAEIAIVGAQWDDDNGIQSGSVYLFETTTGRQIDKLVPRDGAVGDHFGSSVAISGTTATFGASQNFSDNFGSAYLFDTTTGQQLFKLLAEDGDVLDHFGWSVGISGTTAIVGAIWDGDNGGSSGSAYLFDTTTGRQIAKLLPHDGGWGHQFGRSVAINGETAIVGATFDDDNGFYSGSAYFFDLGCPTDCEGDANGDGLVDPLDSGFVLARFGCPVGTGDAGCDTADQNGDGMVDPLDAGFILARFGPCP